MDATRVYEMRRALCPTGKLPPASAALLKELQPQAFVDSGFVSGYLQTNLELGRVLLANLLGLEIHDVALDRYVEVAAKPSPNPNDPNRNPRPNPNPYLNRCLLLARYSATRDMPHATLTPPPSAPRLPLRTRGESRTRRVRAAHAPLAARGARPPAVQAASGSARGRSRSRSIFL